MPGTNGKPERHLLVKVRDNGIGMNEETRRRCLEPFFSTKALSGGSGLGLAMVYGMMQRHAGSVEVESSPGHGTCIRLTFPVQETVSPPVPVAVPPMQSQLSLNVLCIDDDPAIRQLLKDSLMHFAHRVTTANDGKAAIELFRSARLRKDPFDVVITDLGMPEMDGHQLARNIKAESPLTPIILLTGWGALIKEDGITMPEVDALLGKPPQLQDLNELLLKLAAATKRSG